MSGFQVAMDILGHRGCLARVPCVLRTDSVTRILGDRVRSRLCVFGGDRWCLRPDLTAPILIEVTQNPAGVSDQRRYFYHDVAFRLSLDSADDVEFYQAGFEWFGGQADADADVEAIQTVIQAVQVLSVRGMGLRLGDAGLWNRLVDVVEMDEVWRRRFRRAWPGSRSVRQMVQAACAPVKRSALARVLAGVSPDEAAGAIEDVLALEKAGVSGRRDALDIATGLVEAGKVVPLSSSSCDILLSYLDIGGQARASADAIEKMTRRAGVDVSDALERYVARLDRLSGCVRSADTLGWEFGAQFGRGFDYYDGLVFEVTHPALPRAQALARGGRYDGVVSRLGGQAVSALGAALRPDRIAVAAQS